jgi:diguanylate cyclase (GGDEF)-like protein
MSKHIDSLTGLPSRKALENFLDSSIDKDEPVALALLDVDHFMEINKIGGETGDRVLQALAEQLKEHAPGSVFRVSGDEFAVALPGATLEQAFLQMELFRLKIEKGQERYMLEEHGIEVTVTIGVAQYPRDAKNESALNRAASAALMTAKEIGRNQVALPPNEEMIMKSCYYPSTSVRRLKLLAEQLNKKESVLLREALNDLLRKYDQVN